MRGECAAHQIILVVEVIICLQSHRAAAVEQILDVEVAYEIAVARVHRVIAIAKVAVEQQSVIKQLARQRQIHFNVAEVAFIATEIRGDAPIVAQLTEHISQLARERARSHRGELVAAIGVAHIFRRIESVERQKVKNLAIHHVVGADNTLHLARSIGADCREIEVERDVRSTHVASGNQDGIHRHAGAIELAVGCKRLVEVEQVGVERIRRFNVEVSAIRVAVKADAAAFHDGKVLYDDVLEGEVVAALFKFIFSVHAQAFVGAVVGESQVSLAIATNLVATHRVHHHSELRIVVDVGLDVDFKHRRL